MGDGIGGPVVRCISGNAFEIDVTHYRKDNQEQYSRIEKIIIGKIDNPENPEYRETTQEELTETIKIGLENKASGRKFLNKIKSFTSPLKLSDLCNFARTTDKKTNKAFEHVFDTLRKYKLKRDQNAFIWALHDKGYPIDRIENLEIKYGKLGDN